MSPFYSTLISLIFLAVGLFELGLMLFIQGKGVAARERWVRVHRINGYAFLSLFLLMFVTMIWRLEAFWETSSPRVNTHVTLAVLVLFLLMVKVVIPRYFRKLSGNLFAIGLLIYTLSFTLVGITAGYYTVYRVEKRPYISHHQMDANILDLELGKQLFIQECSTCHVLNQIMRPRAEDDWERVVNEMVMLARPRINPDEAAQILNFLIVNFSPQKKAPPSDSGLIGQYCLACHKPTEIFSKDRTVVEWRLIVNQMNQMAPTQVPADKIEAIINELVSNERSHLLPPGGSSRPTVPAAPGR